MIGEVLDHAPAELTTSERLLLLVLAESARDETRTCWPTMEALIRRTGLGDRGVRKALTRLADRGYEVRVAAGTDKNGRPTFAHSGHATVYRLPHFAQRGNQRAALKAEPEGRLPEGKAEPQFHLKAEPQFQKGGTTVPPSLQVPSKEPSNTRASDPSRNGKPGPAWMDGAVDFVIERLTAVATTPKTYDRRDITGAITGFLSGTKVTDPGAYIRKCAAANPLQFAPTPGPERYRRPEENR